MVIAVVKVWAGEGGWEGTTEAPPFLEDASS